MKKIKIFIMMLLCLIPISVKAESYKTLDFKETLADEEIEEKFKSYKPNSDAITIYLFRGKGCGFCRAYLEFMNSITDEYGKYFKMETYEVWNDSKNSSLMTEVSNYLGQPAQGVPYIVIGDKVFGGYNSTYDEEIKEAITELYKTKKNKRYDVFKEMKKNPNKSNGSGLSSDNVILWNFIFVLVSSVIIITYINLKFKELSKKIDEVSKKDHKSNKDKK